MLDTPNRLQRFPFDRLLPLEPENVKWLESFIYNVPDFPKPGINFKDITPLLKNHEAVGYVYEILAKKASDLEVDVVCGLEARGFIFASVVAHMQGLSNVLIRKKGKLPRRSVVVSQGYGLEYGTDEIEIHSDDFVAGQRVLILDDLLATGGTAAAAQELVRKVGGVVVGAGFVIELSALNGRQKLMPNTDTFSILQY